MDQSFLGKVPTSTTSWEFLEKTLFHRDSSKPQLFGGMYPFWPKLPTSRIALGFWYQETSLTDSENIWIGISKVPSESFHHWTIIYSWVGLFSLALKYLFLMQSKDVFEISSICGMGKLSDIFRFYPEFFFLSLQGYFSEASFFLFQTYFLLKLKADGGD